MEASEPVQVKFAGLDFETYLSSINEIREIFWWEVYDQGEAALKNGDVVVDIGANVGTFSLKAIKMRAKAVIAFEPNQTTFNKLLANLDKNISDQHPTAPILFNCALLNRRGNAPLFDGPAPGGNSLLPRRGTPMPSVDVLVDTLDNCLEEAGIKKVDFIKMDVEGVAHYILEGATKTLNQDHLRLGIAVYHHAPEREGVLKILREHGFNIKGYDPAGQLYEESEEAKYKFVQAWK